MSDDLQSLSKVYVECRALLHAWDEIPYDGNSPEKWRITGSVTILEFRCTRCGTIRYDVWSNVTGDLVERTYHTPEGYSLPKGKGRKVLVRKEYLRRYNRPKRLRRIS